MRDDLCEEEEEEEEEQPFNYKRLGLQLKSPGSCRDVRVLKAMVTTLYVLCALLGVAVAVLGYTVVRRVEQSTTSMRTEVERMASLEKDLLELDSQLGQHSENRSGELVPLGVLFQQLREQLRAVSQQAGVMQTGLSRLQETGRAAQSHHDLLQGTLGVQSAAVSRINHTLLQWGARAASAQSAAERLRTELRQGAAERARVRGSAAGLNVTQTRHEEQLESLQRRMGEADRAAVQLLASRHALKQALGMMGADGVWLQERAKGLRGVAEHGTRLADDLQRSLREAGFQVDALEGVMRRNASQVGELLRRRGELERLQGGSSISAGFSNAEAQLTGMEEMLSSVTRNFSVTGQVLGRLVETLTELQAFARAALHHPELLHGLNVSVVQLWADANVLRVRQENLARQVAREVASLTGVVQEMQLLDSRHALLIHNLTVQQGPPGPKGFAGVKGTQGSTGPTGRKGDKGDIGAAGIQGPVGIAGISGPVGVTGDPGATGPTGSVGSKGSRGLQGMQGPKGQKGEPGADGPDGPVGKPGVQGPPGLPGMRGQAGEIGKVGELGPVGPQGLMGRPGVTGVPAPTVATFPSGCPLKWLNFRDRCYFLSREKLKFEEARKNCDFLSSSLVAIGDLEEQLWVQKLAVGKGFFWLGLSDAQVEDSWHWEDGTLLTFTKWKPGQPDNWNQRHADGEDCAGMISEGFWNDFHCEERLGYICERAAGGSREEQQH